MRLGILIAGVITVIAWSSAPAQAQSLTVQWANDRLTIVAADAPLASVLAEVARQTGSQMIGLEKITDAVTVEIHNEMIGDALTTLLAKRNYIMTLAPATGVRRSPSVIVWLDASKRRVMESGGQTLEAASSGPDVFQQQPRMSTNQAELVQLEASGFFAPNAPESSLLTAAVSKNPAVRTRALETLAIQNTTAGVAAINKALEDPDPFVRGEALTLMMSLGNTREDTRRLGDLLLNTNADPAVRINAILTLAEHPGDEPDFLLKRAIASEDPVVKDVATRVLEQREQAKKKK